MSTSYWAVKEMADALRNWCAGLRLLHTDRGTAARLLITDGMMWSDYLARAERIDWDLAAHAYAHDEQLRRYREALAVETAKYEAALRDLAGVKAPPKDAN